MTQQTATEATTTAPDESQPAGDTPVEQELLIEEISIDGMCGVY